MKRLYVIFFVIILFISCDKNKTTSDKPDNKESEKVVNSIIDENKQVEQNDINTIQFAVQTDSNLPFDSDNDVSKLRNNVLVAIRNGEIIDRYYFEDGSEIKIHSIDNSLIQIKTKSNNAFLKRNFVHSNLLIYLSFENDHFIETFRCPESEGSQDGPCIDLQSLNFDGDKIKMTYSYRQRGDVVYVGYGLVSIELEEINDYYFLSDYSIDVKGYFRWADEENEIAVPISEGEEYDFTIDRNVTIDDFLKLFSKNNTKLIYNDSESSFAKTDDDR